MVILAQVADLPKYSPTLHDRGRLAILWLSQGMWGILCPHRISEDVLSPSVAVGCHILGGEQGVSTDPGSGAVLGFRTLSSPYSPHRGTVGPRLLPHSCFSLPCHGVTSCTPCQQGPCALPGTEQDTHTLACSQASPRLHRFPDITSICS